ncbi:hypothetical protein [Caballeronia sp. ATUFL_M2_KS44]|uniref:hypothetical protein n=1 Tax=Caballeronia sp. ATUFL_M2_KS44 TaxID=2921767 RepID=UPI002029074F|nr:hypothetical protein [Caballeronia sp. ATUFL_M2_KS44]
MEKIERNALAHANIAGGAAKSATFTLPAGGASVPAAGTTTQSGSASSTITVNGQTVISQTVTF